MSAYATVDDLVAAATDGWAELAQRSAPDAVVDAAVLQAVATGAHTADWPVDVVAAATAALARLQAALERASRHADGYILPRYRQAMPLTPELLEGSSLPAVVAAIALRRLYGSTVPEDLRRGTAWADEYLQALARGTVSLGAADVQVAQPSGSVSARTRAGAFDWEAY
jgi:phage gp36-like protein